MEVYATYGVGFFGAFEGKTISPRLSGCRGLLSEEELSSESDESELDEGEEEEAEARREGTPPAPGSARATAGTVQGGGEPRTFLQAMGAV